MNGDTTVKELLAAGYGRVRLGADDVAALAALRIAASAFFGRPDADKAPFGEPGIGWQAYATRLAGPDYPGQRDMCERFDFWAGKHEWLPGHAEIPELTAALQAWWQVAARHAVAILDRLARHYGYLGTVDFEPWSYLEISHYGTPAGPVPLIAPHVDGHLLTLVAADQPGFEIQEAGAMTSAWDGADTMLVLPGQLMSTMTSGEIPGALHQVAYRGKDGRQSAMFNVNPPFDRDTTTFTGDLVGIGEKARENATGFGQVVPAVLD